MVIGNIDSDKETKFKFSELGVIEKQDYYLKMNPLIMPHLNEEI